MDAGTSKFLLNWINANVSSSDETVSDIRDVGCKNLLLKILYVIDKETGTDLQSEGEFDLVQVLSLIISYLGGFHRQNLNTVFNDERLRNRDDLEIGKVVTLLLCGATQCDNVSVFVEQITELNIDDQFHFKYLIESVLKEIEGGSLTAESFEAILKTKVNLSENLNLERGGSLSSPMAVQSPVEALFTNSPLKSLVASPQLRSRQNQHMLNKLQQKVMKLQATLDSQTHLQSELEAELTEKNKEIDARDSSILKMRKEITKLMAAADELELMRHSKEEYDRAEKENTRLKQKVVELQTFKQQCGHLEDKVADFMQEKEKFEKERVEAERCKASIERYKTKVHQMEFRTSELEAALSRKEQLIKKLEKDMEEVVCSASMSAQMMREMPQGHAIEINVEDIKLTEDGSPDLSPSNLPVNIDSRIIELEFEKGRLTSQLSSCVDQEEYLALKETLADTQEVQSSYKENYIAAKSRILELEEGLSQAETEIVSLRTEYAAEKANIQGQLQSIQEQCFQEVEELKTTLAKERSERTQLSEELDLKEKRLQQTAVEIEALMSLKDGLEGSLQTCNARANDDKVNFEKELELNREEVGGLKKKAQDDKVQYEKELELKREEVNGLNRQAQDDKFKSEKELELKREEVNGLNKLANDDKVKYEIELELKRQEVDGLNKQAQDDKARYEKELDLKREELNGLNKHAHDDKVKYHNELELKKEEIDGLNKQRRGLEESLSEKLEQIHALQLEQGQIRDAYEQMLAAVKEELDSKIESMKQEKAAALDQFRLKTKQLEEAQDKMKEEFARKQKAMLEEENRNAAKIQEACDSEHAAWKKKFDQLSQEAMDTRTEMFENLKKHSDELMEVRRGAREREDKLDEEARRMREQILGLENELLKANNTVAELECRCESAGLKAGALETSVEQLKKDAEAEQESLRRQTQEQLDKKEAEVEVARQALENLKKEYSELEQRRQGEIEKILAEEKEKDEISKEVKELKTADEEKEKKIQNLEALLKNSLEEKETTVAELKSSCVDWDSKERHLLQKVEELTSHVDEMKEREDAFAELQEHFLTEKELLEQKIDEEALINRRLGTEINSLEAQLTYADRQLREQKQDFENKTRSESIRRQTIGGLKSQLYHRAPLVEEENSTDSEDGLPLQLEDFSGSVGPMEPAASMLSKSNRSLTSLNSVCSLSLRTGVQTRASRRQSAIYLRGNTPPEKRTTNSAAYFILGGGLDTGIEQDSEVEYDWDRLAELERRNASCLPHLQTSYPVETQMQPDVSDQANTHSGTTGRASMDTSMTKLYNTRKRKSEEKAAVTSRSHFRNSQTLPKSKSAPIITPGKRLSSRRIAEAMQSAFGSLRSRSNENILNDGQDPDVSARRESVAYNIDISPPKKVKTGITRRRTISRYTGTSQLFGGEKSKDGLSKKTSNKSLRPSASLQRIPLRTRQAKNNHK